MNKLLPEIDEYEEIVGDFKTFSDCPLNKKIELLSFIDKLQVVNDVIRQTMKVNTKNESYNSVENLCGDSYIASQVAVEYLKKLNLGYNHRVVLPTKRKYYDNFTPNFHTLVLVDDEIGQTYQFDCTPDIGYGCGNVKCIKEELFYDDYIVLNEKLVEIFELLRKICDLINHNAYSDSANMIRQLKNSIPNHGYFKSFVELLDDNYIPKFNGISFNKQIGLWKEELYDLQATDIDLQRQLQLAQMINSELMSVDPSRNKFLNILGEKIRINWITPRLLYDREISLVLIKPSSYKLGISASVRDKFLSRGNGAIFEKLVNMGDKNNEFNLHLMKLFHPHGLKYERSMTGPSDMILIQKSPEETALIKKTIRATYGQYVKEHYVEWFDGDTIYWDPIITNLVHSTDDASEAAMHLLSPNPEYQLMTRYMYPNPVFKKGGKNGKR